MRLTPRFCFDILKLVLIAQERLKEEEEEKEREKEAKIVQRQVEFRSFLAEGYFRFSTNFFPIFLDHSHLLAQKNSVTKFLAGVPKQAERGNAAHQETVAENRW